MNAQKLQIAMAEVERFLARADVVASAPTRQFGTVTHHQASTKDTGAMKRASMDLTRALAELRKPD